MTVDDPDQRLSPPRLAGVARAGLGAGVLLPLASAVPIAGALPPRVHRRWDDALVPAGDAC